MNISDIEKSLNINFINKRLLEQAFIHRSYINESPGLGINHNERLEFLGDAVLELVVTEHLYKKFPDSNEGDLTSYRSALVNAITLSQVAGELGFNDFIRLSKGEAKDTKRARSSILADAYEAFLGALYLDQGYDMTKGFIASSLLTKTENVINEGLYKDSKSLVQERSQEELNLTPSYKLIDEIGPDHDKRFTMAIYFGDQEVARGEGNSKQEAETMAARAALVSKGWVKV